MMTTWSPLARSLFSSRDCSARRMVISGSALNSMPRERDGKIPGANRRTLCIHHDGAGDAHLFPTGTTAPEKKRLQNDDLKTIVIAKGREVQL